MRCQRKRLHENPKQTGKDDRRLSRSRRGGAVTPTGAFLPSRTKTWGELPGRRPERALRNRDGNCYAETSRPLFIASIWVMIVFRIFVLGSVRIRLSPPPHPRRVAMAARLVQSGEPSGHVARRDRPHRPAIRGRGHCFVRSHTEISSGRGQGEFQFFFSAGLSRCTPPDSGPRGWQRRTYLLFIVNWTSRS
jgi:hypothetical protein